MTLRYGLAFFIIMVTVAGCATSLRVSTPTKKNLLFSELMSRYAAYRVDRPMKGLLSITASSEKQRRQTFDAIWAADQDQSRIQGFDLFGRTVMDIQLTEAGMQVYLPVEWESIKKRGGHAAEEDAVFSALALLHLLRQGGMPPYSPYASDETDAWFTLYYTGDDVEPRLEIGPWKSIGRTILQTVLTINKTDAQIKRVDQFGTNQTPIAMFLLDDYREVGGMPFPFFIKNKGAGWEVTLRFQEVVFDDYLEP